MQDQIDKSASALLARINAERAGREGSGGRRRRADATTQTTAATRRPDVEAERVPPDATQMTLLEVVVSQRITINGHINDTPPDFETLLALYKQAEMATSAVILDCTRAQFLRQSAVAFLGGMMRMLQSRGVEVSWLPPELPAVRSSLQKNGFSVALFNEPAYQGQVAAVSYREDQSYGTHAIGTYLEKEWLRSEWIDIDLPLRHMIIGKVHEIYSNAFSHAHSPVGVMSCGQFYPQLSELHLTVVDFGIGIPQNVRAFCNDKAMNDLAALEWAVQDGNSTESTKGLSRGLGLGILREFVTRNRGQLEIYSGRGYLCIDETGQSCYHLGHQFHGTIVNITLNCDGVRYLMESENTTSDDSIF